MLLYMYVFCLFLPLPLSLFFSQKLVKRLMEKERQVILVEGQFGIPGAWGQLCMKVKNAEPSLETRSGGVWTGSASGQWTIKTDRHIQYGVMEESMFQTKLNWVRDFKRGGWFYEGIDSVVVNGASFTSPCLETGLLCSMHQWYCSACSCNGYNRKNKGQRIMGKMQSTI